mmetsp:Transcript_3840/g.13460  ORF Transcript_3840/g.13460 Transcript_3840/m.13460 type:complete len:225 (-) Transcript_3840:459-1133(-)
MPPQRPKGAAVPGESGVGLHPGHDNVQRVRARPRQHPRDPPSHQLGLPLAQTQTRRAQGGDELAIRVEPDPVGDRVCGAAGEQARVEPAQTLPCIVPPQAVERPAERGEGLGGGELELDLGHVNGGEDAHAHQAGESAACDREGVAWSERGRESANEGAPARIGSRARRLGLVLTFKGQDPPELLVESEDQGLLGRLRKHRARQTAVEGPRPLRAGHGAREAPR